jgi:hypothetical protein
MSMSARYHATEWAKGKTAAEITQRIDELLDAPAWQGVEFDDARVRHMRQTEIDTLIELLAAVPAEQPVAPPTTGRVITKEDGTTLVVANPAYVNMVAADGSELRVITHVAEGGVLVVRVFRAADFPGGGALMRGEFAAATIVEV